MTQIDSSNRVSTPVPTIKARDVRKLEDEREARIGALKKNVSNLEGKTDALFKDIGKGIKPGIVKRLYLNARKLLTRLQAEIRMLSVEREGKIDIKWGSQKKIDEHFRELGELKQRVQLIIDRLKGLVPQHEGASDPRNTDRKRFSIGELGNVEPVANGIEGPVLSQETIPETPDTAPEKVTGMTSEAPLPTGIEPSLTCGTTSRTPPETTSLELGTQTVSTDGASGGSVTAKPWVKPEQVNLGELRMPAPLQDDRGMTQYQGDRTGISPGALWTMKKVLRNYGNVRYAGGFQITVNPDVNRKNFISALRYHETRTKDPNRNWPTLVDIWDPSDQRFRTLVLKGRSACMLCVAPHSLVRDDPVAVQIRGWLKDQKPKLIDDFSAIAFNSYGEPDLKGKDVDFTVRTYPVGDDTDPKLKTYYYPKEEEQKRKNREPSKYDETSLYSMHLFGYLHRLPDRFSAAKTATDVVRLCLDGHNSLPIEEVEEMNRATYEYVRDTLEDM